MFAWFCSLDRLLRGEATDVRVLERGEVDVPLPGMTVLTALLGAAYGLCMASFALMRTGGEAYDQAGASMAKVPLLFLLTLVVTFPSLYVFNALVGSRLGFGAVLRLLIAATAVILAVLASFGPIVAFFSVSTTSYPFMVLLNVVMFAVSGLLGMGFLLQTLHRMSVTGMSTHRVSPFTHAGREAVPPAALPVHGAAESAVPRDGGSPQATIAEQLTSDREGLAAVRDFSPLEMPSGQLLGNHVRRVFRCWMIVFGLVGSQMGWVLRPFIGNPDEPFTWFRPRQSNFFEAVWQTLGSLF